VVLRMSSLVRRFLPVLPGPPREQLEPFWALPRTLGKSLFDGAGGAATKPSPASCPTKGHPPYWFHSGDAATACRCCPQRHTLIEEWGHFFGRWAATCRLNVPAADGARHRELQGRAGRRPNHDAKAFSKPARGRDGSHQRRPTDGRLLDLPRSHTGRREHSAHLLDRSRPLPTPYVLHRPRSVPRFSGRRPPRCRGVSPSTRVWNEPGSYGCTGTATK
jgi:hypothetical protein